MGLLGRARELLKRLNEFVIRIESAAGTNARHGASASISSSRDRSRSGAEITSRCVKYAGFQKGFFTLSIRGLRVSVAESDVYTDVALALELAATGSHHHMS